MKIAKKRLKRIILEEVRRALKEADYDLGHGTTVDITRPGRPRRATRSRTEYGVPPSEDLMGMEGVEAASAEQVAAYEKCIAAGLTSADCQRALAGDRKALKKLQRAESALGTRTEYGTTTVDVTRPEDPYMDRIRHIMAVGKGDLPAPADDQTCKIKCTEKVFDLYSTDEEHLKQKVDQYSDFFKKGFFATQPGDRPKVENVKQWKALQACMKKCQAGSTSARISAYMRQNPNAVADDVIDALGLTGDY